MGSVTALELPEIGISQQAFLRMKIKLNWQFHLRTVLKVLRLELQTQQIYILGFEGALSQYKAHFNLFYTSSKKIKSQFQLPAFTVFQLFSYTFIRKFRFERAQRQR